VNPRLLKSDQDGIESPYCRTDCFDEFPVKIRPRWD